MRRFGIALAVCAAASTSNAQRRELTPREQAVHVLSRLTFGARSGDIDRVMSMGVDKWIAEQLQPGKIRDDAVDKALATLSTWSKPVAEAARIPSYAYIPGVVVTYTDSTGKTLTGADTLEATGIRIGGMGAGMIGRNGVFPPASQTAAGKLIHAQLGERQLHEVMADFWENHFSVYAQKMPAPGALAVYTRTAIRPHALGKFRDLLGAVAHHPAMLYYLDNHVNGKGGVNENYARELLELHTLGVDGGYTQNDVIEVARAFTGWSIDPLARVVTFFVTGERFMFRADAHDSAQKVVLGVPLAAGRGMEDGEQVLDLLARHPSTALFISRKLVRRLVSDSPPDALVRRAAATFARTDGDITEVVRAIVTSDEFFARSAFRAKVKTPFELIVSARRAFGAPADTAMGSGRQLDSFGQPTYGRRSPDGWPDDAKSWLTTGSMQARFKLAADIAQGALPHFPVTQWEGWKLADKSVEAQVGGVVRLLLGGIADSATRSALIAAGRERDRFDVRENIQENPFRSMVGVALGSPEFQRR